MDGRADGQTDRRTEGRTDSHSTGRETDRRTDGQTERHGQPGLRRRLGRGWRRRRRLRLPGQEAAGTHCFAVVIGSPGAPRSSLPAPATACQPGNLPPRPWPLPATSGCGHGDGKVGGRQTQPDARRRKRPALATPPFGGDAGGVGSSCALPSGCGAGSSSGAAGSGEEEGSCGRHVLGEKRRQAMLPFGRVGLRPHAYRIRRATTRLGTWRLASRASRGVSPPGSSHGGRRRCCASPGCAASGDSAGGGCGVGGGDSGGG